MLIFMILLACFLFLLLLYCCVRLKSPKEKETDDEKQEAFIANWNKQASASAPDPACNHGSEKCP